MPMYKKCWKFLTYQDARDIIRVKNVASLKAGQFLGDKSFIFNTCRTSNIMCSEDSFFAYLTEEDYKNIIMPVDEARINEVIDFVKQFKLFQDYEKAKLFDINYYFRKMTISNGDLLFKQSEIGEHFYIIINGDFEKLMKIDVTI